MCRVAQSEDAERSVSVFPSIRFDSVELIVGGNDLTGPGFGEFVTDQETIFERLSRGQDPKTSVVIDHGTPGQWHGAKATTAVACQNDEEVLEGLIKNIESHDLTIARFMDLSHTLGCESLILPLSPSQ